MTKSEIIEGSEDDAHLIAAAPELLQVLKAIDEWNTSQSRYSGAKVPKYLIVPIRAAIAKAEGRE